TSAARPDEAPLTRPGVNFDKDTRIDIVPVRGKVYMIVAGGAAGVNITAQVGDEGILLVDSGPRGIAETLERRIRERFNKPIRYIINTSSDPDHTGGNEYLAKTYRTGGPGRAGTIAIIAGAATLARMTGATDDKEEVPEDAQPMTDVAKTARQFYF